MSQRLTSPRTRCTTSELSGAAIETSEAAALATAAGGSRRRASSTSRNNAHLSTLRGHELLRSGQLNTAATPRTSSPLAGESIALSPRISLQQKGLGATLAQQVGGSTRRVVSAFAKADPDRQGRIGPADFASVLRSLGVPVSTNDMAGLSRRGRPPVEGHDRLPGLRLVDRAVARGGARPRGAAAAAHADPRRAPPLRRPRPEPAGQDRRGDLRDRHRHKPGAAARARRLRRGGGLRLAEDSSGVAPREDVDDRRARQEADGRAAPARHRRRGHLRPRHRRLLGRRRPHRRRRL